MAMVGFYKQVLRDEAGTAVLVVEHHKHVMVQEPEADPNEPPRMASCNYVNGDGSACDFTVYIPALPPGVVLPWGQWVYALEAE